MGSEKKHSAKFALNSGLEFVQVSRPPGVMSGGFIADAIGWYRVQRRGWLEQLDPHLFTLMPGQKCGRQAITSCCCEKVFSRNFFSRTFLAGKKNKFRFVSNDTTPHQRKWRTPTKAIWLQNGGWIFSERISCLPQSEALIPSGNWLYSLFHVFGKSKTAVVNGVFNLDATSSVDWAWELLTKDPCREHLGDIYGWETTGKNTSLVKMSRFVTEIDLHALCLRIDSPLLPILSAYLISHQVLRRRKAISVLQERNHHW